QNRRCLNGSDAALDTKAIRQKRGRHRAEKIALTMRKRLALIARQRLPGPATYMRSRLNALT
ncbi:hypothetical protein, partial [Bradyrhizobium sp. 193]|uniref:hypothetical protein n=1 Tax=Bradyrhizobium sp. 193 TaxID=2782661 RepID=UPI001FF9ACDE